MTTCIQSKRWSLEEPRCRIGFFSAWPPVRARQVLEQHVEFRRKEFAITLLEMLLQFRLVRQQAVEAAVQSGVIDRTRPNAQQIIQRGGRIPVLLDPQFARGGAQPVN